MALFLEYSDKVKNIKHPIPKELRNYSSALYQALEKIVPKNNLKNLKDLSTTKKYNRKGVDSKNNGNDPNVKYITTDDAIKRLQRSKRNDITQGGPIVNDFLKRCVKKSTSKEKVSPVEPPKPTSREIKPTQIKNNSIKVGNATITFNENRVIKESLNEEHPFHEYLEDYGVNYVFNEFLTNPSGKQNWGVLINPNMYAKALREFTQYGKLVNFPPRYVYQWMGIIMKNTAILKANTDIAGHSEWFPYDEFENFINSYFKNNRKIGINGDDVKIELSPEDVIKLCEEDFSTLNEAVDKYGQTYFPWISQSDADGMAARQDLERKKAKFSQIYGDIEEYVAEFNKKSNYKGKIEIDYNTNKLFWLVDCLNFLDLIGFYDWMQMPDGSDAFSDFGISPLERVLSEYDESLPPEKVLVIVNKALDIYHQRGDMSSIFITGGSRSLSRIAEHKEKNPKKIYITENQIIKIKHGKRY